MQRRISLAVALAFTTVVTFAVIAIGAQAGVFSEHKASNAAAEEAPAVAPADAAAAPGDAPVSAPQVIVETEYVDVQDPPAAGNPSAANPAPSATVRAAATLTTGPGATRTAAATQTAKATATTPPAPTGTAGQPKPTATTAAAPAEIEFVGSVTAINGNQVTFQHGGSLTTVQVSNPGALAVGVSAHVHALLKPGGYVATEVQVGG